MHLGFIVGFIGSRIFVCFFVCMSLAGGFLVFTRLSRVFFFSYSQNCGCYFIDYLVAIPNDILLG